MCLQCNLLLKNWSVRVQILDFGDPIADEAISSFISAASGQERPLLLNYPEVHDYFRATLNRKVRKE